MGADERIFSQKNKVLVCEQTSRAYLRAGFESIQKVRSLEFSDL